MIDFDKLQTTLTAIVNDYEKTAPTVSDWANDLYVRLTDDVDSIRLVEIMAADDIHASKMHPSYAANKVYKLMNRLGQDTTGHTGF